MALPRLLDAEGGLRLARYRGPNRAQLARAAHRSVDEEAVDHSVDPEREIAVAQQELVRHAATEAIVPARFIEAQQVLAIATRLDSPHLADQSAVGERVEFVHQDLRSESATAG